MNTLSYERSSLGRWAGVVLQETYRLGRRIGRGAMGEVYEAGHARLPGKFALKILHPELAGNRDAFARFCREAEIMSALRHPHIVQIFDFNTTPDGLPYFVMEYLDGLDLEACLARTGPLPMPRAAAVVQAVASALGAAHAHGIVHRDLKPANIFLLEFEGQSQEFVKVLDFGISKVRAAGIRLSRGGEIYGTPQFMAPEQALGRPDDVDARTDQFALAAIAYEMLAGQSAFAGDEAAAVIYRVVHENPEPLARFVPWDTSMMQAALDRALAKERPDRFETIGDFARAFQAAADAATPREPPRATLPRLGQADVVEPPRQLVVLPAPVDDPPPPVRAPAPLPPEPVDGIDAVEPSLPAIADEAPPRRKRARHATPVDWDLPSDVDRVPVSPYRAVLLGMVAVGIAALAYVEGWHRELPADLAFLRENGMSVLRRSPPLPQRTAPQPRETAATEAAPALPPVVVPPEQTPPPPPQPN